MPIGQGSTCDGPATACTGKVEAAIRMGGLADIKSERIKAILATLLQERGQICLEYLRDMQDEAIKVELTRCGTAMRWSPASA